MFNSFMNIPFAYSHAKANKIAISPTLIAPLQNTNLLFHSKIIFTSRIKIIFMKDHDISEIDMESVHVHFQALMRSGLILESLLRLFVFRPQVPHLLRAV